MPHNHHRRHLAAEMYNLLTQTIKHWAAMKINTLKSTQMFFLGTHFGQHLIFISQQTLQILLLLSLNRDLYPLCLIYQWEIIYFAWIKVESVCFSEWFLELNKNIEYMFRAIVSTVSQIKFKSYEDMKHTQITYISTRVDKHTEDQRFSLGFCWPLR